MRSPRIRSRRRRRLPRTLGVETLEGRVTPGRLVPGAADGTGPGGVLGDSGITAPAPVGATEPPTLVISKTVTPGFPDAIRPGDTASFTITVSNIFGGGPATNVVVTDQLPAADQLTWTVTSSTFDVTSISTGDFLFASSHTLLAGATASIVLSAIIPQDVFGFATGGSGDPVAAGVFELDGNATAGLLGTAGSAVPSHDWDQVFRDAVNRTSTSGAIAASFVTDVVKSSRDDVFTDRPRDTRGIQAGPWRFKDGKSPAVYDIGHAFAATTVDPTNDHVLLFAGLDRYDNSAEVSAGFWFFRNPIGEDSGGTRSGGHPFAGRHADGDVLLLTDFTAGGSASAVRVFRWTGDESTGSLVPVTAPAGTTFAIGNGAPVPAPWPFQDKRHNAGPAAGEFLEAGVDLTALGLDGFFSSFLAETRSAGDPTATLSDFVIGAFNTGRLDLPNTAALEADGTEPMNSNFALVSVFGDGAALGAGPDPSAPASVDAADSTGGGKLRPGGSGSVRGSNLPARHTGALAGTVPPAAEQPGQLLTSEATPAVTRDKSRAAASPAGTGRVLRMVGREIGRGPGDRRVGEEGPAQAVGDLWQPASEALAPLEV